MSGIGKRLHLIVEGEGDAVAVPKLIHKIWREKNIQDVQLTPAPFHSGNVGTALRNLERFVGAAMKHQCPVLWVLDCDDKKNGELGCPVTHMQTLRDALQTVYQPQPLAFAFFTKEFESLFLAEQQALKTHYQLESTVQMDANAAAKRDAKGQISRLLPSGRAYKETTDQAAIASLLNLETCRQVSRDFRHFESALLRLCNAHG